MNNSLNHSILLVFANLVLQFMCSLLAIKFYNFYQKINVLISILLQSKEFVKIDFRELNYAFIDLIAATTSGFDFP